MYSHIRYARRTANVVLALCGSLVGFVLFAPSAFAMIARPMGGASPVVSPQPQPIVLRTVVTGGMAGWLIALIAVGAALLAGTVAVVTDRARSAQRKPSVSGA
jgi:hypothetical protein